MATNESKLKRNMPTLFILIISGALIYALPYFRYYYYDAFVESFGITDTQMGLLGTAFGGMSIVGYCLGGFTADRWNAKNLVVISLITTGALGFVLLTYPPYPVVFAVHAAWGITSILTFWNALVKVLRSIANSDEQGRAFGLFEGGRGIVNMVQSAIILAMFGVLSAKFGDIAGLNGIITAYSIICILLGILVFFLYKDVPAEATDPSEKKLFNKKAFIRVAKLPTTWLQILIIFCSYAMIISYFYITPYATSVFGASVVVAAAMGYFSQYCRPVGCFVGGFFADKIGASIVLLISFIIMFVGIVGITLVPGEPSLVWLLLMFCAAIYASMYSVQSMHFAIMEEGEYPIEVTGTATAIITPFGYSAEFFMPVICGFCLDNWDGVDGYKAIFTILAGLAVIGIIATIAWIKLTSAKRAQLAAARKEKAAKA